MDDELKEKAESAAKTYFGTDNLDVYCIPEHDAFLDAYEVGYAAALNDDGWTYCDDRLPEEDDEFLVLYDFGDDSTGPFHSTAEFFAEGEDPAGWLVHRATNPTARVIAYRPLEPAKGRDV